MKTTINYIKNEKEVTRKLNILNYLKTYIELFKDNYFPEHLILKDNIDFVNIKNASLTGIEEITSNRESLCILDNCTMKKSKNNYRSALTFDTGSFQIINPEFEIKEIKLESTKDVSMHFSKEDCYEIRSKSNCWKGIIKNIEIYSNYSVRNLNLEANKIQLYGLFNLSRLYIDNCEKVIIGSTAQFTKIKLNIPYYSIIITTDELNLTNCLIINESKEWLRIDCEKLIGNNFLIKSKGDIIINGHIIPKARNEQGYIEITLDDIVKDNFMSTLYGIRRKAEHSVKNKADNLMPQKFGSHILSEIDKLNDEKSKIEQKITNLKENYETAKELKNKKLIKQLRKEPISNLDI